MTEDAYGSFLNTKAGDKWRRFGTHRRAGAATPLFSIYSKKSVGIGEFPDLNLLAGWCKSAGMSIIQLLPMNDVGTSFRPYDADSTFAIEPMYLRLEDMIDVHFLPFKKDVAKLKRNFPTGGGRVNYGVKAAKLAILRRMFEASTPGEGFKEYKVAKAYWLEDWALFRVLKDLHENKSWEDWPEAHKLRDAGALDEIRGVHARDIEFYAWLQWQAWMQFRAAKSYALGKGVYILGDLPFLVSRDSADVWANQRYFKLHLLAGAPPDAFFAAGQRWGMPPYNWEAIAGDDWKFLIERVKTAEEFYDLFRIDHVVGTFRLWTIRADEPAESQGMNGSFEPVDEKDWEEHGRRILGTMLDHSTMLPCAEDLGVVPAVSYTVLSEFGIPGIDVARWARDWAQTNDFKQPETWRKGSIGVISTHDTTPLGVWWKYEIETVDEDLFCRKCLTRGIDYNGVKDRLFDFGRSAHGRLRWREEIRSAHDIRVVLGLSEEEAADFVVLFVTSYEEKKKFMKLLGDENETPPEKMTPDFARRIHTKTSEAAPVFSIQLVQDWLALDPGFDSERWEYRINFPGTTDDKNWALTYPYSLEQMKRLPIVKTIKTIHTKTKRK